MYTKKTPEQAIAELKGRKMQGDNFVVSLITFFVNITILLPVWLFVLLPLTIVFGLYHGLKKKTQPVYLDVTTVAANMKPQNERKYDLIMYGATGFTGRLSCLYLAKQYPKLKWAIGGRSQSKLEKIKKELVGINPQLEKDLDIVVADSFNAEQLTKLVEDTKTVISTVGPFSDYGHYLVALCAQYGTNYCDITGEFDWVKVMIEKYDDLATKSGAKIVSCCGYDCTPFDLTTLYLGKEMEKQHGQKLSVADLYIEGYFNPSGGTLLSINRIICNPPSFKTSFKFDPNLKLTGKNEGSLNKIKNGLRVMIGYHKELKNYIGFSPMGVCNYAIVSRTSALTNLFSSNFKYCESSQYPNLFSVINAIFQILVLLPIMVITPLYKTIGQIVMPKPGEGPSEQEMNKGYLILTGYGEGEKGAKIQAQFTLPTDPGYRDTARMLVESGLSLSLNADEIKVGGGFYTPASCQGEVLIKRLSDTGATMSLKK